MLMLKRSKKQGIGWDYIKERHPEVVDELKTLRDWDSVKSAIPESETIRDYSVLALEAVAATIRELRIDREMLAERIEILNRKFEELSSSHKESTHSLEKRIKELEDQLAELEQRTLFLDSVEMLVPRLNEIDERMERLSAEILRRVEEHYSKRMDDFIRTYIEERLKSFEGELKRSIFGVSVDLSETLLRIQQHYEELVAENVRLRSVVKEREELKRALAEKEREIEELKRKLAVLREMSKRVNTLSKRLSDYEAKLAEMSRIQKELAALTGTRDVDEALNILKTQFIPKSKFESTLREVKGILSEIEEIRQENARLRIENEKLKEVLKTLFQERLEESVGSESEETSSSSFDDNKPG
ncbi:hypothetical protein, conserved [Thermococcus onnurineus NA1]|uniref:Uncharacterized protein n=1 Tax=Thermococcus onnurineus (strain NA1) TaxID=523850 RepID=B6YX82_THEON|nr:hypothetical protein [Thermococcus onnurineus]ACJ16695.1 hypothetical protein, conserved [Thermococcus onnurineus NA1]